MSRQVAFCLVEGGEKGVLKSPTVGDRQNPGYEYRLFDLLVESIARAPTAASTQSTVKSQYPWNSVTPE